MTVSVRYNEDKVREIADQVARMTGGVFTLGEAVRGTPWGNGKASTLFSSGDGSRVWDGRDSARRAAAFHAAVAEVWRERCGVVLTPEVSDAVADLRSSFQRPPVRMAYAQGKTAAYDQVSKARTA